MKLSDLHTRACLAKVIISAVENFRDAEGESDYDFRIRAQGNAFLSEADTYLETWPHMCECHVYAISRVKELIGLGEISQAQSLCQAYLDNRDISPEQYIQLVRLSEGRPSSV